MRSLLPLLTRREAVACGLGALLATACKRHCTNGATEALRPEDPVDESFLGCQKSCGARTTSHPVVLQPYAMPGDFTRCPVSGAAFQISDATPRREYLGRPVFLCCISCARYFDQHADTVAALRRL